MEQNDQDALRAYLNQPGGKFLIKELRKQSMAGRINRNNPDPNACVYQAAQVAMVRFIEKLAGVQHENLDN